MTTPELQKIYPDWEIIGLLGEGAFGKVYEIRRGGGSLEAHAALKVIHIPQSENEARLLRSEGNDVSAHYEEVARQLSDEIAAQAKLKGNSNIVHCEDRKIVPDGDGIGQTILIRMELLRPLPALMEEGALGQEQVLQLGRDMARALLLCERHRIIHRDIKPQNIFISPNGDFKLGDFGMAKQLEQTASFLPRKGTYNFMAPEVFHGRPCDAAVDIYSLGVVLYTLLNGNRAPFLPPFASNATVTSRDRETAQTRRLSGEPLPPLPCVSAALGDVIARMCAFDPKDRYQNARELVGALESAAYELQGERTVSMWSLIGSGAPGAAMPIDGITEDHWRW
ncbi:MAG: serine/threonine protein kinase [Oscillospiraceae bacterium]|nr:serine/threonine protein kinase [Oscillospiraceae bacterium]